MLAILNPSLLHKADCSIELPSLQGLDVSWGVLALLLVSILHDYFTH